MNVLLLSEDGSEDARPTLLALAKKMMQLVDGQCRTNHHENITQPLTAAIGVVAQRACEAKTGS